MQAFQGSMIKNQEQL